MNHAEMEVVKSFIWVLGCIVAFGYVVSKFFDHLLERYAKRLRHDRLCAERQRVWDEMNKPHVTPEDEPVWYRAAQHAEDMDGTQQAIDKLADAHRHSWTRCSVCRERKPCIVRDGVPFCAECIENRPTSIKAREERIRRVMSEINNATHCVTMTEDGMTYFVNLSLKELLKALANRNNILIDAHRLEDRLVPRFDVQQGWYHAALYRLAEEQGFKLVPKAYGYDCVPPCNHDATTTRDGSDCGCGQ